MKKLLTCFFALVVVAPAAIAADGAISRVLPTSGVSNADTNSVSRTTVSRTVARTNTGSDDVKSAAPNIVRSTVSRVFSGESKSDTSTVNPSVARTNIITRAVSTNKNSENIARSNLDAAVNTVGRNSRVSAASINSNPVVRRAGLTLRPSTAEVGGRAIIDDSGVQTGSNIDEAVRSVQSRAASSTKTATRESIAEATERLEQTATLNKSCQEQYNDCMDQFCAVIDANQGRCSCSSNLSRYTKVENAVKDANTQLNEVAQRIRYVGLSADEIRAIMNETEAEEVLSGAVDTSETRNMLEEIEDLIRDPVSNTSYSSDTYSGLDLDLDFSSDTADLFSLDFLNTNSSSFSNLRGADLYNAAKKRCNSVLTQCKNAGATSQQITGNYDLAIDKDCIAYEQGLTKMNETLVSNVRSANLMLQKARLAVLQNKNQYDAKGCIAALNTCMADDMVCGDNYFKCVDPTKRYIDENGEVVLGQDISLITEFMTNYNNATITDDYIKNAYEKQSMTPESCKANPSGDPKMGGNDGSCVAAYLMQKIGTKQVVTDEGLCRAVLNKCQRYTYDSNGNYLPWNDVVVNYVQRAMVNIRAAQRQIISDYASTCMVDIATCYNQQVTQVNAWSSSASVESVRNVMRGACRNVALTCAYAVFADDTTSCPTGTSGVDTCVNNISQMFYQSLLCPDNSTYDDAAVTTFGNGTGYVNAHCKCISGYEVRGNSCVAVCVGDEYRNSNGNCVKPSTGGDSTNNNGDVLLSCDGGYWVKVLDVGNTICVKSDTFGDTVFNVVMDLKSLVGDSVITLGRDNDGNYVISVEGEELAEDEWGTVCGPNGAAYSNGSCVISGSGTVSFGGTCTKAEQCKTTNAVCSSSKCACPMGNVYSSANDMCSKSSNPSGGGDAAEGSLGAACEAPTDCYNVENSICGASGKCVCAEGYTQSGASCALNESGSGTDNPSIGGGEGEVEEGYLGSACKTSDDCNEYYYGVCSDGICGCVNGYHESDGQCVYSGTDIMPPLFANHIGGTVALHGTCSMKNDCATANAGCVGFSCQCYNGYLEYDGRCVKGSTIAEVYNPLYLYHRARYDYASCDSNINICQGTNVSCFAGESCGCDGYSYDGASWYTLGNDCVRYTGMDVVPNGLLGGKCSSDSDCSARLGNAICQKGMCICADEYMPSYVSESNATFAQCVIDTTILGFDYGAFGDKKYRHLGGACMWSEPFRHGCVDPNTHCSSYNACVCDEGYTGVSGKCVKNAGACADGQVWHNGSCKSFGDGVLDGTTCRGDLECPTGAWCAWRAPSGPAEWSSQKCVCEPGKYEIGGACVEPIAADTAKPCPDNAHRVAVSGGYACRCNDGYIMADTGACAKKENAKGEIQWGYQYDGGYGYAGRKGEFLCPWGYGYDATTGNCMLNRQACGNFCSSDVGGSASYGIHVNYAENLDMVECPSTDVLEAEFDSRGWDFTDVKSVGGGTNDFCYAWATNPGGLIFAIPLKEDWMNSAISENGSPLAEYDADAVLRYNMGSIYDLPQQGDWVIAINDEELALPRGGDEFERGDWDGKVEGRYLSVAYARQYYPRDIYNFVNAVKELNPDANICLVGGKIRETGQQVWTYGGVRSDKLEDYLPDMSRYSPPYIIDLEWGTVISSRCVPKSEDK